MDTGVSLLETARSGAFLDEELEVERPRALYLSLSALC